MEHASRNVIINGARYEFEHRQFRDVESVRAREAVCAKCNATLTPGSGCNHMYLDTNGQPWTYQGGELVRAVVKKPD